MSRNYLIPYSLLSTVFIATASAVSVQAQGLPSTAALAPITLAQAAPPPQIIPTDETPFTTAPERNKFSSDYKFRIFQALPERLWFNSSVEVSQRLDTNVLFTYDHPKANYAFRALPNLTVGYNIFKNTSVYGNYFVIKDVFARNYNGITFPTTQSLSWGIRHVKQYGAKTTMQYDFQARELWQTKDLHQFDFLPGATLTRVLTPNNIIYGSVLLQLRGGDYFVAPTREIDPFYTIGYIHRHGLWTFVATDTLVTNFRHPPFNDSVPAQSNVTMIADFEINHPVSKKFSGLLAFARAEPIWNWDSNKVAGLSGFDFRFFTGLRLSIGKPSYYGAIENLRKQVIAPDELKQTDTPPVKQNSSYDGASDDAKSTNTSSSNTNSSDIDSETIIDSSSATPSTASTATPPATLPEAIPVASLPQH